MVQFYAICINQFELAQLFWQKSDDSLVNALIASRLFKAISESEVTNQVSKTLAMLTA
jgi:hypothetical protein